MKRISESQDRFEADENETITVTVEAKQTPHDVTFSNDAESPNFTQVLNPPPLEKKSFKMGSGDTSFSIVYRFPPPPQRDPKAHYLVTFEGKDGTSDGPTKIKCLPTLNSIALLYEFFPSKPKPAKAAIKKAATKAAVKKAAKHK